MNTYENTKAALKAYDEDAPAREARWEAAETDAEVEDAKRVDNATVDKVRQALWEDVKEDAPLKAIGLLSIMDIRELVGFPYRPGSVSLGEVEFGRAPQFSREVIPYDERVKLLFMVLDGQELPGNLKPIKPMFGHGWRVIDRDSIDWRGLRDVIR